MGLTQFVRSLVIDRRRSTSALLPALFISLAMHAAAGVLLLNNWQRSPVTIKPPQPLAVTLETSPRVAFENQPPQIDSKHLHRTLTPTPSLSPVAVERVEALPLAVTPRRESPPAPAIVVNAPAAVSAAGRADVIEPPHFNVANLNNPRPAYPLVARELGLEGKVVLRVQVTATGAPERVVIAQTSGAPILDEAALQAVQVWAFVPARRGDVPVAYAVDVPIRFQLKN